MASRCGVSRASRVQAQELRPVPVSGEPLGRELEPGRPPVEADREHHPAVDANGTEEPGVDETLFVSDGTKNVRAPPHFRSNLRTTRNTSPVRLAAWSS